MKHAAMLAAGFAMASGPANAACEIALALTLDISSSVNARENEVQNGGFARALRDPIVQAAVLALPGSVALIAYEWSGWQQQDSTANWALIETTTDLERFAARIEDHKREYTKLSTAIGKALIYGADLFDRLPHTCTRHLIDVSGDGVNNEDIAPGSERVEARLAGVTVVALVIEGATPPPSDHYRDEVIFGPGGLHDGGAKRI